MKNQKSKFLNSNKLCDSNIVRENIIWGKELDSEKISSESSGIYSNSIQASLFVWDKTNKLYKGNKKQLIKNRKF